MNLIAYIISSILLSWVGAGVYLAFRRTRPGIRARRLMLWLIVGISLTMPLTPGFNQVVLSSGNPVFAQPGTPPLPADPQTLHDFCHCETPNAGDVIMYQASRIYDVLLSNQHIILIVLLVIGFLSLLRLGFRLGLIWRLTRGYSAERIEVAGHKLRRIRGFERLAAGSIRFGGKYVFWHDRLDALPEAEQQAILLHELSHIRQFNTHEKLFLGFLQAIWLINPALYFFGRELEMLSEYTADEYAAGAAGNRKAYASLLLKIKSSAQFAPVHFFRGGRLRKRIERVLSPPVPRRGFQYFPAFLVALVFLFPGEIATQNLINEQIRDIRVYQFLTIQNHQSGASEFCRKCTYEAVDNCQ